MIVIPLNAVPAQSLVTQLSGQTVQLNVYQKFYGVFIDVLVSNTVIISGVLALNGVLIVRSQYLGFSGDFAFWDTYSPTTPLNPYYTGLGSRYQLVYYLPTDLPSGVY
jgi:hypothetical protein